MKFNFFFQIANEELEIGDSVSLELRDKVTEIRFTTFDDVNKSTVYL